jgi:hypothetical protein
MKIYQVGPDVPYDLPGEDDQRFEWVVFWYEDGGYDGSGEAVGLCKDDGLLYIKDLGHCSCYGPMDGGLESGDKMTVEDFLKHNESVLAYEPKDEIKSKVAELLQWKAPVFFEKFNFLNS